MIKILITGLVAAAMIVPATATADVTAVTVKTPGGELPAVPTTVLPAIAAYGEYGGPNHPDCFPTGLKIPCAAVDFGSAGQGIAVSVTFSLPTTAVQYLTAWDGWGSTGYALIPAGTTQYDGVIPNRTPNVYGSWEMDEWQAQGDCTAGLDPTQTGQPCGLTLYLDDSGKNNVESLGTITVAAYEPAATVVGDPTFKFRAVFRANTTLRFKRFNGTTVHRRALGWLAPGRHSVSIRCPAGEKGRTLYVTARGVAKDGSAQLSPAAKLHC